MIYHFDRYAIIEIWNSLWDSLIPRSPSEVFLVKGVLRIYSKFTGKHPCRGAISIKLLCNTSGGLLWFDFIEPYSSFGNEILKIFFQFPEFLFKSYFVYTIQILLHFENFLVRLSYAHWANVCWVWM